MKYYYGFDARTMKNDSNFTLGSLRRGYFEAHLILLLPSLTDFNDKLRTKITHVSNNDSCLIF